MSTRSITASSLIAVAQKKRKPKRAARSKAVSSAIDPALSWDEGAPSTVPGLITIGVGRGVAAVRRAASWGATTWLAIAAAVAVGTMAVNAWRLAPEPEPLATARFEHAGDIPAPLKREWVRGFPAYRDLARSPDRAVLSAFADHLAAQPAVAKVRSVRVEWDTDGRHQPRRLVAIDLELREPRLPIMLDSGQRAWVDEQGVVLPGLMPGPKGEPVVRGYHREDLAAMREVLAVWPDLKPRLPAGLVTEIHLHHPLGSGDQRGIVFKTRGGTLLIWGAPGEGRYGLDADTKIRNLVHTLDCQGDLSQVQALNVRFSDPFAIDARRH